MLFDREPLHFERAVGQCLPNMLRQGRQQIRLPNFHPQPQKRRQIPHNPPLDPSPRQSRLQQLLPCPGNDLHMPLGAVARQVHAFAQTRMLRITQTNPVLLEQHLLIHPPTQPRHEADGQVRLARFQRAFGVVIDPRRHQPEPGAAPWTSGA
ncbi:hypothetical protein D3C77_203300 [compost metagenome]